MKFYRNNFLFGGIALALAIVIFSGTAFAQFSVSVSGSSPTSAPLPAATPAPSGQFTITATVTNVPNSLVKVVFYRNDVPYQTSTGSNLTPTLAQNDLWQDSYTYRARAYDSSGAWADSGDIRLAVETPRVFTMGVGITYPSPYPGPSPTPPATSGAQRDHDHSDEIQNAVNYLNQLGGGTLYFPCRGGRIGNAPYADPTSIYNIRKTITIPANVTLQGESSEEVVGQCQILWADVDWYTTTPIQTNPDKPPPPDCHDNPPTRQFPLTNRPMFRLSGNTNRVRFKDLWIYSRSSGRNCYPRYDLERIAGEDTVAVLLDAQLRSSLSDVVFENVSISNFTYAVKAVGRSVSDVRIRGLRPVGNTKALSINATYAYDWDVQNVNATLLTGQEAVEIVSAGAPTLPPVGNPKLKFLQVNCGGDTTRTPGSCVRVKKHGGLYFKGLFHEGLDQALVVENFASAADETNNIPIVNTEPIVLEYGVATGEFKNASMKLYLIDNAVAAAPEISAPNLDKGRMNFTGAGVNSTVVDCGDLHHDLSDVDGYPTVGSDLQMSFTHSERNREGFFMPTVTPLGTKFFPKPHTICPSGQAGVPNINEVGGEYFNSGVLPTERFLPYSNVLTAGSNCTSPATCAAALQSMLNDSYNRGTVYIDGSVTVDRTIFIPSGRQLVGGKTAAGVESELVLSNFIPTCDIVSCTQELLRIDVPLGTRTSSIAVRNLKLKNSHTASPVIALAIIGDRYPSASASSDLHFSGLTIEGFNKGLKVAPFEAIAGSGNPMVDGCSWKHLRFVNNQTAADLASANLSNWNVMDLSMKSNTSNAVGWDELYAGTVMQNIACEASAGKMTHCIRLKMAGLFLTDFRKAVNVVNALTFGEGATVFENPYKALVYGNVALRNNDFSSDDPDLNRVNSAGKVHLMSMNNRYKNFAAASGIYEGNLSRVTYCGDDFGGVSNPAFPGLADEHPNLYVGVPTLTRNKCGVRAKFWEPVVRWGGEQRTAAVDDYYDTDQPLVGNFYDDSREDIVIYRAGSPSSFFIKKSGGTETMQINYTISAAADDKPLIGRFFPNERAQVAVFNAGQWWVKDPDSAGSYLWNWGLSGDVPFVGNFIAEYGTSITGNMDEIAIYRPSSRTIWIENPRSGQYFAFPRGADYGSVIQVGDFLGAGYDQIAQVKNGVWTIIDPRTAAEYTDTLGVDGDTPVAGKYLPGTVAQLGVWHPETQEFIVKNLGACGTCVSKLKWGSNNFGTATHADDDLPLRINLETNGTLHRPATYRQKKGLYKWGIANGQWWIHDPF